MPVRRPLSGLIALFVLALTLLGAGNLGWARYRADRLVARAPRLDQDLARHLATDGEPEWQRYAHALGPRALMDGYSALYRELHGRSFVDFENDRAYFRPFLLRISASIGAECACPQPERYARWFLALSAREDYYIHDLCLQYVNAISVDGLTAAERLQRLDRILAETYRVGDTTLVATVQSSSARYELEAGHPERHRTRMDVALSCARQVEDRYLECQILGELGSMFASTGESDSMRQCFEDALALASRHRFPDQIARILTFEARHEARESRLALAADRLIEARDRCEAYRGGSSRVRLAVEFAAFLNDLGCWDLAQQSLRRVPPLLRAFPSANEAATMAHYRFQSDCERARAAFALGQPDEGESILTPWLTQLPPGSGRVGLARVFRAWAWGLHRNHRWSEALAVCERGLAHCDSAHVPDVALTLALRKARLFEQLSRLDEAASAIADVESRITLMGPDPKTRRALAGIRASLALRRGHIGEGRAAMRRVFEELSRRDPQVEPDLLDQEMYDGISLRDDAHALAGMTPAAGYGFEMAWRSMALASPRERLRRAAPEIDPFAAVDVPERGVHLVYRFLGSRLLRFTATHAGVSRDTLALTPEQCRLAVQQVATLLESEPVPTGHVVGPQSAAALDELARVLLPGAIRAGDDDELPVWISPDGPLQMLPFEALPVKGPDGEARLGMRSDVAYLVGWRAPHRPALGPPLIVGNPAFPAELRRRYGWSESLPGSDAEMRHAKRFWPDAIVLQREQATKAAFLRQAPGAGAIYIAAHQTHDPVAPFLAFVPLAIGLGGDRSDAFLEANDVRALDLDGCRMVGLAVCASGLPDPLRGHTGPSLADAFLDAGAECVVRSFWDVGDLETRAFMERLFTIQRNCDDPARALRLARRAAIPSRGGVPPRVWATWSVSITRPRPTPDAPRALAGN